MCLVVLFNETFFIQCIFIPYASPCRASEWSRHSRNVSRQSTPAAPMNIITQGTSGLVASSSSLALSSHCHHRKVSKKRSQQETHGTQRPCTGNWSGYINKQPSHTWLTQNTSWHSTNRAGTMSAQHPFQNPPHQVPLNRMLVVDIAQQCRTQRPGA